MLEGGHFACYAPTGYLVYSQNGNLLAVGFNADKVEVTGKPVPLVQNVATNEGSGFAQFAIAHIGTLIYVSGTIDTLEELSRPKINVVLNWFEELKERVPTD